MTGASTKRSQPSQIMESTPSSQKYASIFFRCFVLVWSLTACDFQTSPFTLTPSLCYTQNIEAQPTSTTHHPTYVADTPITPSSDRSPLSSNSQPSHTASLPSTCACLQQQVTLVYQLGNLQDLPTVDRILRSIELVQEPWEDLMRCARCRSPENQKEVFLLFATSIRIVQSSVKKLVPSSFCVDTLLDTTTCKSTLDISNTNVLVGSFPLTGEAKAEVITVILRRAVRIVTSALSHLRSRVGMTDQHFGISEKVGAFSTSSLLQSTI
jgi:hypothetical protein